MTVNLPLGCEPDDTVPAISQLSEPKLEAEHRQGPVAEQPPHSKYS